MKPVASASDNGSHDTLICVSLSLPTVMFLGGGGTIHNKFINRLGEIDLPPSSVKNIALVDIPVDTLLLGTTLTSYGMKATIITISHEFTFKNSCHT